MTTTYDKRMLNLPKWARERITVLEMQLGELREQVATLYGSTPTDTCWSYYTTPKWLPKGELVTFSMPGPRDRDFHVGARVTSEGVLDIFASSRLVVMPGASNHIIVKAMD